MSYANGPKIVTDGLVLCLDAANTKSVDPLMDDVSLLLHMDGANGSTTFTDVSKNNLSFTANGNAQVSSLVGKFGSSAYFDGNGDYISNAGSAGFAFGTGPFTVEAWINCSSLPTTNNYAGIIGTYTTINGASNDAWFLSVRNNGGTMTLWLQRHGDGNIYAYSNWTPSLNTWYHVAACRDSSGVIHLFIDGVKQSVTSTNNWSSGNFTRSGPIGIGVIATPYYFHGYIDEVRVIKGKALYTSSFSPQKKPYNNPNTFYDLSGNGNNGSLVNGVGYNSGNNGSLSFDGVNDYVSIGSQNLIGTGTSPFSTELWFYNTRDWSNGQYTMPIRIKQDTEFFLALYNPSGILNIYPVFRGNTQWGIPVIKADYINKWISICIVYNGENKSSASSYLTYVNGIQLPYGTNNFGTAGGTNSNCNIIGADGNSGCNVFDGYYQGNIGTYKIYNNALSSSEIRQNFEATKGRYGL